jgi:Ca2+-binding EF-hand superfamily protein
MADAMDAAASPMFEGEPKRSFGNPLHNEQPTTVAEVNDDQSLSPTTRLSRFASADTAKAHRQLKEQRRHQHRLSYDGHDPEQVDKMRALFDAFDTDGNGEIDAEELQDGLEEMGVRISPVDSRNMLKSIDRVGKDGEINFDDFYEVMHSAGAATGEAHDVVQAFVGIRGHVTGGSKLIMECEEDEEHLAKPAMGEGDDLFDILQKGLEDGDHTIGGNTADEALEIFNMADTDHNDILEPKELRAVVTTVMGADVVTDAVFKNLFRQIDVDDSGDVTIGEFRDWWMLRSEEDSDGVALDPQAIALRKMEQASGMISPTSRFRQRCDIFQAILLVYVAITVPYQVCFDDEADVGSPFFFLGLLLDIYFIMDVFLNFRTAIISRDGEVVYEHRAVARAYAQSWFPVDFISCLPFGYMHIILPNTNNRGARMFRLLKLLRLVRIKRILDRWEEELYSVGAVKLAKLVALIALSAHWLCCGWYFVGRPLPDEEQVGWVVRSYPDGFETVPKMDLYKDAGFWALMAVVMVRSSPICVFSFVRSSVRALTSVCSIAPTQVGTADADGARHPILWSEKAMFASSFMVGAVVVSMREISSFLHEILQV